MSKFKKDDMVKVVQEEYDGQSPVFTDTMKKYTGQIHRVRRVGGFVYLEGITQSWHDDWLELAEEEFNPMPEIKAGDDVYHDHGGCGEYSKVILQTNGSLVIVCWSTYEAVSLESLNIAKVFKESAGVVWEYKEPPKSTPEFTMEELQDKLGYEFKLVKGGK